MKLGDTFIPPPAVSEHLWVVITDPRHSSDIVIVNVTTRRAGSDDACMIAAGEHSFVVHDSVIAYERARLVTQQELGVIEASCRIQAPVSHELLARIQHGAIASEFTPEKVRRSVQEHLHRS